jgi:pimeloyl-ACP methyl ester carboxylesterase
VSPQPSGASSIAWKPCTNGLECGSIVVPLDAARPGGDQVRIVLARRPASDPANRVGSIVLGVGGPGQSGTTALQMSAPFLSDELRERWDIVAFDVRGVGLSNPVHCLTQRPELDLAYPRNAAEEALFFASAEAVADACEANSGDMLPFVGTADAVADLDAIRAALGDERLTYLGWSYGTLLGALYAERHPDRVRAMVLDAPIDPTLDLEGLLTQMARGHQRQLDRFLDGCGSGEGCPFAVGNDPAQAYRELMARFADGSYDGVAQRVALEGVSGALSAGDTAGLVMALEEVRNGDVDLLSAIGSAGQEPTYLDPMDAILCADMPGPRTPDEQAALADRLTAVSPDFGAFLAYRQLDCAAWPIEAQRPPARIRAASAPPILLVTSTGDPAATPEMAESLASQLASAILLTRVGDGHTSIPGDACVTEIAERYLDTLATPEPGTTCP